MTEKLRLLWVDLTVTGADPALPDGIEQWFEVTRCAGSHGLSRELSRVKPEAVCFDYDFPDRPGLRLAAETKQTFPSTPMLMSTVQHSESLAIWAFRSRLTDYLVKPISQEELQRVYQVLHDMAGLRHDQSRRRLTRPPVLMPSEAITAAKSPESALLPAIYYVQEHYGEKIVAEEVAKLCAMSPYRFSRNFHEAFGLTFRDYVVRYRLKEAKRLLRNPQASVTDIAFAVGFNDVSYFSRMFKRHFGAAPSVVHDQPRRPPGGGGSEAEPEPTVIALRLPLPQLMN